MIGNQTDLFFLACNVKAATFHSKCTQMYKSYYLGFHNFHLAALAFAFQQVLIGFFL